MKTHSQIQPQFYQLPPSGNMELDEIDKILNFRLLKLEYIESKLLNLKQYHSTQYDLIANKVEHDEKNDKELSKINWMNNQQNDVTSHFILSIAFCKNEQLRAWFSNMESKLFILRTSYHKLCLEEILKTMGIPLQKETNIVDMKLLEKINFRREGTTTGSSSTINDEIFKLPFEYALNLIPTMQYFLHKGYIYISKLELPGLIENVFKDMLLKKLINLNKNIDRILSDQRIAKLVREIEIKREIHSYNNNPSEKAKSINAKDLESSIEKSYPLCMQLLHKALVTNNHLKHNGRLQYGLFLKGAGLSLEESMTFWKKHFCKKIAEDKFEKEYAYNIRHNYGKEGKRTDYTPWGCERIQSLPPMGSGETHGCPFKTYSEDKLKTILYDMKFADLDIAKILEKKRNNEYSVACIRFFEARHPNPKVMPVGIGINPNNYYDSSRKCLDPNWTGTTEKKKKIEYEVKN